MKFAGIELQHRTSYYVLLAQKNTQSLCSFFLNSRLFTQRMLQLQILKLKESLQQCYRLDQNYVKTKKDRTTVLIIHTIALDLLINRLFSKLKFLTNRRKGFFKIVPLIDSNLKFIQR